MKRKIALVLTMAMLGTCLAGCGQADTDTNASTEAKDTTAAAGTEAAETTEAEKEWYGTEDGKTITLHFCGGVQPEYGYDDLCANFNEQYKDKGLQVEYVRYVNDDNGNLQLETYLMGGGDVDLFIGYGGRAKMDKRVDSNLLLDMSGMLNDIGFNLDDELGVANMAEYHYDDGAVYGFPTKYENSRWILINEDMFKEAGLDIPYDGWTYSEFLAAAEKLTHGEGQDKVYGVCWARKQSGNSILLALDAVLGANQIYKNEEGTEVNFDNDVYRAGLNLVKETLDKGYAIPIEDEFSEDLSVANTFLQGKCAIMLGVAQMRLCMDQENYPHDFMTALVPAPVPDDEKYNTEFYRKQIGTNGAGDLLSISANTKYPEASFEFAMWYLKGGMSPLVKGGRIPLWNGVDENEVLNVLKEKAQGSINMDSMENYLSLDTTQGVAAIKGHASPEISSAWFQEFDAMCYGKQSVDQTIQNMEKRGNELIQTELSSQK